MSDMHLEERVGPHYAKTKMLEARRHTWHAIEKIAAGIRPGMLESEGVELAKTVLRDLGLLRGWHGVYLRFGPNTLLTYWDKDAPDAVLRDNDIFYIDIGPVWEKWEGDGGDTFVVGNDPEMHRARTAVRQVFDRVHESWRTKSLTGAALYAYASEVARSRDGSWCPASMAIASATFHTRHFTQGRLQRRPSRPPPTCGCSRSRFGTPRSRSGHFTKTCCSNRAASGSAQRIAAADTYGLGLRLG